MRRVLIACELTFTLAFLPSIITVLVCKFGLKTFFVWRWEKLTLLPNCLPLPVISHFCIASKYTLSTPDKSNEVILDKYDW